MNVYPRAIFSLVKGEGKRIVVLFLVSNVAMRRLFLGSVHIVAWHQKNTGWF
jgi:hypothetical protein